MIKSNILNESYIPLQKEISNTEKFINEELSKLSFDILNELEETENNIYFKYKPLIESIINYDYKNGLANLAKKFSKSETVNIKEAMLFSKIYNDIYNFQNKNYEYSCISEGFGIENISLIKESYNTFKLKDSKEAIRNISLFQEEVQNILNNINKNKSLLENLLLLGEIKLLTELK